LEEIGEKFHLSRERIRQILERSLSIESKIKDLFEQMKGLEGDLRRLTKTQLYVFEEGKEEIFLIICCIKRD
jgi:hypothetical protein